jgi:hypothetical protein
MKKTNTFRTQKRNTNKHTERGLSMLEESLSKDGFIGAMTATADGEIIDGSARLEKSGKVLEKPPMVIEVDGTHPVIVKRMDIPNADDPRAKRLAVAANRIAEVNLDYDQNLLDEISREVDLNYLLDHPDDEPIGEIQSEQLRPFKRVHVLISCELDKVEIVQSAIEPIMNLEGIEIETAAN